MKLPVCLVLSLFVPLGSASATVVASPAAGYFKLTAQGAADTVLSVPLVKRSALLSRVVSVETNKITIAQSDISDDQYAPAGGEVYYLQFASGNLAGWSCKVLSNTGSTFTLDTNGETLTSHPLGGIAAGATGDLVRVQAAWTVAEVFGDGSEVRVAPVASLPGKIYSNSDAVLLPDNVTAGTDKRPALAMSYVAGIGWRTADAGLDASRLALPQSVPFTVRRQAENSVELLLFGYVPRGRFALRFPEVGAEQNVDFSFALPNPEPLPLGASGLFSTDASHTIVAASTSATELKDVMLDFATDRQGFDRPFAHRWHVVGASWFQETTPADDAVLQPGAGYMLRSKGSHDARYWFVTPSY
jgi:uncharacterized protein (TIGR02597 family)